MNAENLPPPAAPAVPQPIQRTLRHPRFEDLIKEEPADDVYVQANIRKVSDLFDVLLATGLLKMKPGNSECKKAWIKLYDDMWNNDPSNPGPFAAHAMHTSQDYQNKLRDLVKKLVPHFAKQYELKATQFYEEGNEPVCTSNEEKAYKLHCQQQSAEEERKHIDDEKKPAAALKSIANDEMEGYLGALPGECGVSAPADVEMNEFVEQGLLCLGGRTKSFTARQDLNPRSSCASTETFVIDDAPNAPQGSTPRAPSTKEAKKIELANDKVAARKAAGPAVDAKKKRNKSGPKNRIYPKTEDVVDFADVMSEKLLQGTSMLNSLIQHNILPLQASTRHNSPPSTPKKRRADEITDINAIDEKIKQLRKEAEQESDEEEVQDIKARIKQYKKLRKEGEQKLFKSNGNV